MNVKVRSKLCGGLFFINTVSGSSVTGRKIGSSSFQPALGPTIGTCVQARENVLICKDVGRRSYDGLSDAYSRFEKACLTGMCKKERSSAWGFTIQISTRYQAQLSYEVVPPLRKPFEGRTSFHYSVVSVVAKQTLI